MRDVTLLSAAAAAVISLSSAHVYPQDVDILEYQKKLGKIFEIQKQIQSLHPFFERLFPVAVVKGRTFYIFDLNPEASGYDLVNETQPDMIVPKGVRAAFPLDFYDNKMACVVSDDVFNELTGYVFIFHEFVHCMQMESGEMELKARLRVAQNAAARGDFMWELEHPFPYGDGLFQEAYSLFLEAAEKKDLDTVSRCRMTLRDMLNLEDYEYMVWQEWKEGFARYLENKIRLALDLPENRNQPDPPFNRVTFYEGGARLITLLNEQDKSLEADLPRLFSRMFGTVFD